GVRIFIILRENRAPDTYRDLVKTGPAIRNCKQILIRRSEEDCGKVRAGDAELFVVGPKGEPYEPKTPEMLGPLARAIDHNRSAIHAVCGKDELTLGTLVYTQALGITPLGGRYVVFTRHRPSEISVMSVQDSIISHF